MRRQCVPGPLFGPGDEANATVDSVATFRVDMCSTFAIYVDLHLCACICTH